VWVSTAGNSPHKHIGNPLGAAIKSDFVANLAQQRQFNYAEKKNLFPYKCGWDRSSLGKNSWQTPKKVQVEFLRCDDNL